MAYICEKAWMAVSRRKQLHGDLMVTPLKRCLTSLDLTMLGIGHLVGAGIYVLTGTVARNEAGPAICLSYIVSGIAALLSALCFAELAVKIPKTGSSYTYAYVAMGELWALIVGWNMVLENGIGAALVSRSFSAVVNVLSGGRIVNATEECVGVIHIGSSQAPPDFVAFVVVLTFAIFVAIGVKFNVGLNSALTVINIGCLVTVIAAAYYKADIANWTQVPGGFFPYGTAGIFKGAATCFYAYVGFDGIAIASEETKNPSRSIPMAMCIAMATAMILYVLASTSLTLMTPYTMLDLSAPFTVAFADVGMTWAQFVVTIGTICALATALLIFTFALARCVFAMAEDGLLYRCLAYVHPRTQTPLVATLVSGFIAAVLAMVIELEILVEMISIGTLSAYAIVALSLLLLRYDPVTSTECAPTTMSENSRGDWLPVPNADETKILDNEARRVGYLQQWLKEHNWLKVMIVWLSKHIEAETIWTPLRRRHFEVHFLEWKYLNFD